MNDKSKVAFALGGLAGNNAHGAGFLQAALTENIEPAMISCTSGQIYWTYEYLRQRREPKPDLREVLKRDIDKLQAFHNADLDLTALSVFGKPGVFRTVYPELVSDAVQNATNAVQKALGGRAPKSLVRQSLEMLPCRFLAPDFPEGFFAGISEEFQKSAIGIVFNSYNPRQGHEHVYLNAAARELLGQSSRPHQFDHGQRNCYRDRTIYQDITPEAVRAGLWLYGYGFDQDKDRFVDGAYFRDVILSELVFAETIYVARPLHFHWAGKMPKNYPDMEDLKTEVAFNGSYAGERCQIQLVNKLLDDRALSQAKQKKYHPIKLIEIETDRPRGYFGYVFEDLGVFDHARGEAEQRFRTAGGAEPVG